MGAQSTYRPQLDGIRAIAVGLVMLAHYLPPLNVYLPGGGVGVRIFFVLSGYLITGILLDVQTRAGTQSRFLTLRQFYLRRTFRIFPVYFLAIAIAYAANVPPARELFAWFATFTSNWYMAITGKGMGSLSPYWSIAVEEQFYLIWPWLLLFLPTRFLPALFPIVVVASTAFRLLGSLAGIEPMMLYTSTFAAVDALALGGWLASLERRGADATLRSVCLYIGVPAFLILYGLNIADALTPFLGTLYWTSTAWAAAWLIGRAAKGGKWALGGLLEWGPSRFIGRISYGLYVYHMLIYALIGMTLERLGIPWDRYEMARVAAQFSLSLLVSTLSFYAFEKPINDLNRYFPYVVRRGRPDDAERAPQS